MLQIPVVSCEDAFRPTSTSSTKYILSQSQGVTDYSFEEGGAVAIGNAKEFKSQNVEHATWQVFSILVFSSGANHLWFAYCAATHAGWLHTACIRTNLVRLMAFTPCSQHSGSQIPRKGPEDLCRNHSEMATIHVPLWKDYVVWFKVLGPYHN